MNSVLWLGVDVLKAIKGHGPSDWEAYGVSIDTRTLKKGDIFWFIRYNFIRRKLKINPKK